MDAALLQRFVEVSLDGDVALHWLANCLITSDALKNANLHWQLQIDMDCLLVQTHILLASTYQSS